MIRKFESFNSERVIVLNDIKPLGNLTDTLQKFIDKVELCEKDGYSSEVNRLIGLIIDFGFCDYDWFDDVDSDDDLKEVESIVIIGRVLVIRLNNLAQKKINNIDMDSVANQLMKDSEFMSYFPNTKFV